MNDIELKTHVPEEVHEEFLVLSRMLGFTSKSEFLRFIVTREVKGVMPQLQSNAPRYGLAGQSSGQQGVK
ncbi:hypothetical protein [Thiomicrorhabdus sp.]|uniref:hypothetical protein n=1 Tax=Thiomicrorhabdus sp. TaxID=2039724 RepID=UPI0029C62CBF|nr:hypothetical protein [Thiomicrorhabdus sp.]